MQQRGSKLHQIPWETADLTCTVYVVSRSPPDWYDRTVVQTQLHRYTFFNFVKVAQRNPSLASKTTENTPLLKNASQLKCARLFSSSPHASDSSGGEPGVSSCQREARLSPPFQWKLVTEKLVGISPFSPSSSSSPFYHFMAPLPPPTGASSKCFKRWLFVTIRHHARRHITALLTSVLVKLAFRDGVWAWGDQSGTFLIKRLSVRLF